MSRGIPGNRDWRYVPRFATDIWRCESVMMGMKDRVPAGGVMLYGL
jgi:hypothetical protein